MQQIKFRTGPHLGIPYEQARALGLSSALKGPEFYEGYKDTIKVTTPSERMLRAPFKWPEDGATTRALMCGPYGGTMTGQTQTIRDALVSAAEIFARECQLPLKWCLPVPFTVLKPARKEKPE